MDRRQAWQEVARAVEGRFIEGKRKGMDRVEVQHGPWTATLDTYTVNTGQVTVTYTRVMAHYTGREELKLTVRSRNWLDSLAEALGFRGVTSLDPALLRRYVVKGRPASRLRSVVTDEVARDLLAEPKGPRLSIRKASRKVRKRMGPDACMVAMQAMGVITDTERLERFFQVVTHMLDALERSGLAVRQSRS